MTGRSLIVQVATTALIIGAAVGYSVAPAPKQMPAAVAETLVVHRIERSVDSARVKQLETENARLKVKAQGAFDTAAMVAEAGLRQGRRADALQALAIAAQTVADSARLWRQTALARKAEADSAWIANKLLTVTVETQASELAGKDAIISTTKARAERAEKDVARLIPLATGDDGCRVLWRMKCPTRTQSAIAGTLIGVAGILAASR